LTLPRPSGNALLNHIVQLIFGFALVISLHFLQHAAVSHWLVSFSILFSLSILFAVNTCFPSPPLHHRLSLPSFAPSGDYHAKVQGVDSNGNLLFCVELDLNL
jgi:hypothetical protein